MDGVKIPSTEDRIVQLEGENQRLRDLVSRVERVSISTAKSLGIQLEQHRQRANAAEALAAERQQEIEKMRGHRCRNGMAHYCPNCGRNFDDIFEALPSASKE